MVAVLLALAGQLGDESGQVVRADLLEVRLTLDLLAVCHKTAALSPVLRDSQSLSLRMSLRTQCKLRSRACRSQNVCS